MNQKLLRNLLVGLVAILVLGLASQIYLNRGLSKELDLRNASDLLSLQEKCNEQAKKIAFSPNYRVIPAAGIRTYQEYQSHYNPKLKKCFAAIRTSSDKGSEALNYRISFIDPIENRDYGSYMWLKESAKGSLYYGDNPHICRMQASQKDEKRCSSLKEFESFVASYME
jgi:hypothetical protein